jgi:molecular chaperone GrpE
MTDHESDEQILDQFRKWLLATRQEAAALDEGPGHVPPPSPGFGIERLVEEFTALRHELKLQTRSSRTLQERVEASLTSLAEAASTFRSAAASVPAPGSAPADKSFAMALAELDDALERGSEQWKKNSARLTGPSSSVLLAQLNDLYERQTWWQRRRTAAHHRRICQQLEQAEEQAHRERRALLTALLSGYDLIQQRLARTLANVGVVRIRTLGRPVDPEQMVVVDVVDGEGVPGQVIEEIRRGYMWQGGVLRLAEVRAIRPRFDEENPA